MNQFSKSGSKALKQAMNWLAVEFLMDLIDF